MSREERRVPSLPRGNSNEMTGMFVGGSGSNLDGQSLDLTDVDWSRSGGDEPTFIHVSMHEDISLPSCPPVEPGQNERSGVVRSSYPLSNTGGPNGRNESYVWVPKWLASAPTWLKVTIALSVVLLVGAIGLVVVATSSKNGNEKSASSTLSDPSDGSPTTSPAFIGENSTFSPAIFSNNTFPPSFSGIPMILASSQPTRLPSSPPGQTPNEPADTTPVQTPIKPTGNRPTPGETPTEPGPTPVTSPTDVDGGRAGPRPVLRAPCSTESTKYRSNTGVSTLQRNSRSSLRTRVGRIQDSLLGQGHPFRDTLGVPTL